MAGIDWANRTWQAQKYHYRAVSRWQAALLPLLRHDADREDSDYQALRHGTGFVSLLFSSLLPPSHLRVACAPALYLLCVLVLVPAVAVLSLAAPSVVTTTTKPFS